MDDGGVSVIVERDVVTNEAEVPEEMPVPVPVPVPEAAEVEVVFVEWYGPYARLRSAGEVGLHASVIVKYVVVYVEVVVLIDHVSI